MSSRVYFYEQPERRWASPDNARRHWHLLYKVQKRESFAVPFPLLLKCSSVHKSDPGRCLCNLFPLIILLSMNIRSKSNKLNAGK